MSTRLLPEVPSLSHLKYQAKDLLRALKAGEPGAFQRVDGVFPSREKAQQRKYALSDALLVVAREYGFSSWSNLKRYVDGLAEVEAQVSTLRSKFAAGDRQAKAAILAPAHARERFENYDPQGAELTPGDARLLLANKEGYATWRKYESVLHLDPAVRDVIAAVRSGDLKQLRELLKHNPGAANPRWVDGYPAPLPIYNDSIPLFCASEAVFRGTNRHGNEYELVRELIGAGADPDLSDSEPLRGAGSFDVIRVAEALLDGGAKVDGVAGDGMPMSYPMLFGFTAITELLAARGAKLDLRFAAGLGLLKKVQSYFPADGGLTPEAGTLADAYSPWVNGQRAFLAPRTRENILGQALLFACLHNRFEVVEYLLKNRAEVNAIVRGVDTKATVLHRLCCVGNEPRRLKMIQFLLEHGASTKIKDEEFNSTPVGWAKHNNYMQIHRLLTEWDQSHP